MRIYKCKIDKEKLQIRTVKEKSMPANKPPRNLMLRVYKHVLVASDQYDGSDPSLACPYEGSALS